MKVNIEFHSTFATIAVTILSIMLAFYGITVISLAGVAQVAKQNEQTYLEKAQTDKESAVSYLMKVDGAIRTFVYTTEPTPSLGNWSITMEQEENLQMVLNPDLKNATSNAVVNSEINSILSNFTKAQKEESNINFKQWLSHNNVTYFLADYNTMIFNIHDLIQIFYQQFPSPPARRNQSQIIFFSNNFSDTQPFLNWFEKYQSYYSVVSDAHSKLSVAFLGVNQAYNDSVVMETQEIKQLQQINGNWSWTIQSMQEDIAFNRALERYYPTVFGALDDINSNGMNVKFYINQYSNDTNQSQRYLTQYNSIRKVAFSSILPTFVTMIFWGIVIPTSLIGLSNWLEPKLCNKKRQYLYYVVTITYILFFTVTTLYFVNTLSKQIFTIFP